MEARLGSLGSFGVMFPTVKDLVLGNFLNLLFLGDEDSPSERVSKELVEAVLSQVLVVLVEHSGMWKVTPWTANAVLVTGIN